MGAALPADAAAAEGLNMPMLLGPALGALGVSAGIAGPLGNILMFGLSLLLSILFRPEVPRPEAGRTPFKQPVPPRIRILGRRRSSGAHMLYHSYRGSTFHGIIAACEGEVAEFTRFYLHDDVVEVLDTVVQGIASDGPNRYGQEKVHIYTRTGLPTETAYTPANSPAMKDLTGVWSADHRGDGIASALIVAADAGVDDQAQRFPFGIPQLSVEVDATRVYDPRATGGIGSAGGSGPFGSAGSGISGAFGAQDWADPSTWSFAGNDNPILQAMWFVTASIEQGGMGLSLEECFSTVLEDVAAQADICDEAVPLKAGGSEKRYLSGALYHFDDSPGEVLAAILGTCDGFMAERGDGAFELKAGKWDDDDFAIILQDKHIISLNVRRFRPDEDDVTGVIVKYNSVAHEHQTIDAPVWPRDAYQGGEDHRIRSIEILYCPQGVQAQRLSKRVATYEMAPVTGTAVLKMYGILLLDRRGATMQCSDDPALADAKLRLTRVEPDLVNGLVTIDFQVFDPVVCDAWDAATEEGPLQPAVSVPIDDAKTIPDDLVAVASLIGAAISLQLQFDPGEEPANNFTLRWRLADVGGGVPGEWTQASFSSGAVDKPEDRRWIVTVNTIPAEEIEVQIRGDGSPGYSVSAFADGTNPSPGMVVTFTGLLAGSDVDLDWRSPKSSNFDHARVYRAIHGAGFGLASDISGPIVGASNTLQTYLDVAPGSGDYDYWVAAETVADLASLPRGPQNVAVP